MLTAECGHLCVIRKGGALVVVDQKGRDSGQECSWPAALRGSGSVERASGPCACTLASLELTSVPYDINTSTRLRHQDARDGMALPPQALAVTRDRASPST